MITILKIRKLKIIPNDAILVIADVLGLCQNCLYESGLKVTEKVFDQKERKLYIG